MNPPYFARRRARAVALALALMAAAPWGSPRIGHAASLVPKAPRWLVANTKARTATLTLIAGYNNVGGGFNFDGYANGAMVVGVPSGYRVIVVYSNKGQYPHSVVITPYAKKNALTDFPLAFRGAASADPANGVATGTTQRFSFTANRVGTYAIICAVGGHEQAGMWDVLKVTRGDAPFFTIARDRR